MRASRVIARFKLKESLEYRIFDKFDPKNTAGSDFSHEVAVVLAPKRHESDDELWHVVDQTTNVSLAAYKHSKDAYDHVGYHNFMWQKATG